MGFFFVYILKSSVCLAVFYLFYRLLLSRETFHRFNRVALLSILLLSCLLPLVEVTVKQQSEVHQTMMTLEQWLLLADTMDANVVQTEKAMVTWIQVALLVYLAGILFFVFRNGCSLLQLGKLLRSGRKEDIGKYIDGKEKVTLIVHNRDISPFSWMKYIAISQKDLEENGWEILIHELAHIQNRHSCDLLIADICIFFQWFNPASWLLKLELQNIHEYEADGMVIEKGVDAKQYQLLLIKKAVGTRLYSMANSFNHSKLKKRITMMLKEKSSPWAMLRYLYVLPVAAIAVTAFARPEVSETTEEISAFKVNDLAALVEAKVAKSITVVQADAALSDTTRVSGAKNVSNLEIGAREGTAWNIEAGTISGAETPLFIVDGKEVASSLIAALKPESIKSITVLKDGSATETYGEKGKNGVILITLKTGQDPVVVGYRVRTDSGAKDSSQLTKILFKTANEATTESDLTVFIDGVETDMTGKKLDDVIPADQIEAIHVKKGGGKKGIYVVSKKTVTKVSAKDDIK